MADEQGDFSVPEGLVLAWQVGDLGSEGSEQGKAMI